MWVSQRLLVASSVAMLAAACATADTRLAPTRELGAGPTAGGVHAPAAAGTPPDAKAADGGDGDGGGQPGGGGAEPQGGGKLPAGAARPGAVGHGPALARAPGLAPVVSAQRVQARRTSGALSAHAERIEQRVAAYERWGLEAPPAPSEPPEVKDRARGAKVFSRVPTDDKVIFLTVDDGAEQDPEFLKLVRELDLPVSSFLTDEEVRGPGGAGYDYFRELERFGGSTHNHTLHHPYLPALSKERQRHEICGQQDVLKTELGGPQPRLFRPPYGSYDRNTLRAARECGIDGVVLWGMEAWADRIEFPRPGKQLYPGAIVLTHFRGPAEWGGTMADMTRRLLRLAAEQGYSVARLEDYL